MLPQNMKHLFSALLTVISLAAFAQTPPTANFTGSPTTVCLGQPVLFTSTSTQGTAAITSYAYDFGDGNAATTANASHVYSTPGTYTVTLVVQASNGQADAEVKTNYITVNPTPTANFSASTNGCSLPVGVTFTNTSTGGASYAWNFGSGNPGTSTQQNPPLVNYSTAGTNNVSLIVTNSFGCKDTLIQSIVVSNFQAGITVPATACQNSPVLIEDNSTVGANAWNWTFTGGSPGASSSQDNTVTFSAPGTYTISLNSQNTNLGCNGNATANITILPTPTPSFTNTPTTGCAPLAVNFTNTSPAGTQFVWDFGDGTPTFTGQNPPTHVYNTNGNYTATLTMTGANGCVGTYSAVAVNMNAPTAAFTSDVINGCDPLTVQFSDASSASNPIDTWFWDFGDGTTFNGQTPPAHVYPVGVYDVTLVISAGGCVDTISLDEYIQVGHIDLVDFDIDETPQCAKTPIHFTNQSVISAPHDPDEVTYNWDFGDGGTSTQENPDYQYPSDTGYFDVTLIVTFRGCKDTLIVTDAVYIKAPISIFSPAQTLYCNPASFPVNVVVNDNSKIGALPDDCSMTWDWGDGTFTNFDDPDFDDVNLGSTSHNYNAYGTYTIEQLIINSTTGCKDSTTTTIYISQTIAGISPLANDSVCVGSSFSLDDNSTSTHPFGTYSWNMGNGQTVTGSNPTYAYPSFGTFTITLTATNSVGCADDATFAPMIALSLPSAQISADDATGCAPHLVTFTNNSTLTNNGVPLDTFVFTFSDDGSTQNTSSVGTTVNHTFNTEGVFTVSLVATDEFGCVSPPGSVNITITKPTAAFTADAVVCELENFVASNSSTGVAPLTYQWFVDGTPTSTSQDFPTSHDEPSSNSVSSWDHTYTLIATDANGCKDTITHTVTVSTPVAIIDYVLDGAATNSNGDYLCPPVFADFTDGSLSYGNVNSYTWNFGDGKTSTLTDPNNTYVFPGTYSVSLSITDEFGCTSDTTLVDYLTIFGPTADPSWFQDPTVCGQLVDFTTGATSNVTSITWNMGDGTTVLDSTDFTYGYLDVTTYNPTLTVEDSNGCIVIYPLDPITIPPNGLNAYFTINPNPCNLGDQVIFDDQSTGNNIISWTWDLANIDPFTNNNGASVSSIYVTPGSQTITLVIQDANGCFDSYTAILEVSGDFVMPNVITTDGNGVNDLFSFQYPIFQSFNITIVNRWGEVVKEGKNQTGTVFWDGTNKGGEYVHDGVYFYILDAILVDGTPLRKDGFVQVFSNTK